MAMNFRRGRGLGCFAFCAFISIVLVIVSRGIHKPSWNLAAIKKWAVPPGSSSSLLDNQRSLVIWSNDFHIGPIQDVKNILEPLGVHFIDKSLSGHCTLTKTCAKDLRVLNRNNAMTPTTDVVSKFIKAYANDIEMKTVSAFICFHPSAMCEVFMPFNKSLLVIASTRYEMARTKPDKWKEWNNNLRTIASQEKNVVAANNLYDAKYIQYFTGFEPLLLPSYCGYIDETYNPKRDGFLLAPVHKKGFQDRFLKGFTEACGNLAFNCTVNLHPLRKMYPHYKYSDLVAHQGIVYVPYQVSTMSLFEQYAMNIPLFFPSQELLAQWQLEDMVMVERTWAGVHGKRPSKSPIPPHPSQSNIPDPNCETNITAIKHWIQYADFYQRPHIVLYESYEDLIHKLMQVNGTLISQQMKKFNKRFKKDLTNKWKEILNRIRSHL